MEDSTKNKDVEKISNISDNQQNTKDYGTYYTQGLYNTETEYNTDMVYILIDDNKLAPFYKGLSDYVENPILKEETENIIQNNSEKISSININSNETLKLKKTNEELNKSSFSIINIDSSKENETLNNNSIDISSIQIKFEEIYSKEMIFKYPILCPICFLYYPRNINYTSCCDQPICTECFTQIKPIIDKKNSEISKPPNCPYCAHTNFGVYYLSPESVDYKEQYEMLVKAKELDDTECQKLIIDEIIPKKKMDFNTLLEEQVISSEKIYSNWVQKQEEILNNDNDIQNNENEFFEPNLRKKIFSYSFYIILFLLLIFNKD